MKRESRPTAHLGGHAGPNPRGSGSHPTHGEGRERRATSTSVRKKVRGSGKELLYCFGGLAAVGVILFVLYNQRKQEQQQAEEHREAQEKIFKLNLQRGFATCKLAETAGFNFLSTGEKTEDAQLFGPFKNDDRIYNVVYERNYKGERQPFLSEQKAMYPGRLWLLQMHELSGQDAGVTCCYGFAENKAVPVVVAKKVVRSKEGDEVNLGGMVTVMVKADNDERFERARQPPKPERNR
jgi:hypothetical protein